MSEKITPLPWVTYAKQRPETVGVFEWRIPSTAVEGMSVIVAAHMRERGAGYENVISPSFDYWDGYRVSVPKGLEWRDASPENKDVQPHERRLLGIDGLALSPCPYCKTTPRVKGVQRVREGTLLCAPPHNFNTWWLDCCEWAKTPHLSDPRELERMRREAIGSALTARVKELEEALAKYADKENWGYYDESGCDKGHGRYTEACFIGPEIAQTALNKEPT